MARQIKFTVDKQVFNKFPNYRRAILVVTNVNNNQASILSDDIEKTAVSIKSTVTLEDTRINAWRDAFITIGIKVRDFKPSIDALVRRILNDKPLGSINPIVDVGTIVSLQYILPAGAHPILNDTSDVLLNFASGKEIEISDGIHPSEQISYNELILLDNDRVATRRWVWRQTSQSRIDTNTKDFYLNIDALKIIDDVTLNSAIEYSRELIRKIFGKESVLVILSASNMTQTVNI